MCWGLCVCRGRIGGVSVVDAAFQYGLKCMCERVDANDLATTCKVVVTWQKTCDVQKQENGSNKLPA